MRRSRAIGPGRGSRLDGGQGADHLARHDPRRARCSCPTAGRSSRPAGRRSWAICRSRSPCIPSEPILAILHAGYGEHEIVTVDGVERQGHRPGRPARELRRPDLVGRRQAALRRRRVRRPDLPLRPRRRPAVEEDRLRVSRPQGVPGGSRIPRDGRDGQEAPARAGGPGAHQGRQDALRLRGVRPFAGPVRRRVGRVSRRDRARGRQLSLRPGARRVAQAALRQPLEQGQGGRRQHRHASRSPATGRPRSTPTRCCWRRGARSCTSPTPTATRSRVIDTEAGKPIETIGTAIDPKAPPGSTPNSLALSPDESMLFVANANTNNLAVVNVKDPGGSAPLGFIPVGWYPTSVRLARDGKTIYVANGKGASSRANRDGPRPGFAGRPEPDAANTSAVSSRARSRRSRCPTPRQMAAYSQTVYECSPLRRGDPAGVRGAAPRAGPPDPRQGRRPVADQVRRLRRQGEPHLRPGLRRHEGRQRRAEHLPVPRGRHAQPPRPGPRVRAAGQLLRRERGQRRRPRMVDGGLCHRLRRADLAARLSRRPPRPVSRRRGAARRGRQAGRRLPLGQGRREGGQLSQLRRVRRQRQDRRPSPATTSVKALEGHFDPDVPQLRHGLSRRQSAPTDSSRSWPGSRRPARCRGW